jgi:hypothetical protein
MLLRRRIVLEHLVHVAIIGTLTAARRSRTPASVIVIAVAFIRLRRAAAMGVVGAHRLTARRSIVKAFLELLVVRRRRRWSARLGYRLSSVARLPSEARRRIEGTIAADRTLRRSAGAGLK